jgi:hypothetical protein
MDPTLIVTLTLLALPVSPRHQPAWTPLAAEEAAILSEVRAAELADLRAGALEETAPLEDAERAALAAAEEEAGELADQRGGDLNLSDREVKIIAITAAAILVLVLIL